MLQNLVVEYEKFADPRLPACSRKADHLLETSCTIMDLKGVGVSRASSVYGYIREASAISQNYYPERMGKLFIINAPWGFSSVFGFVKGFLDPVTVAKIHILGSDYPKKLQEQVPAHNLPKSIGGTCDCPGGCMFADLGPWKEAQYTKPAAWEQNRSNVIDTDAGSPSATDAPAPVPGKAPKLVGQAINEGRAPTAGHRAA